MKIKIFLIIISCAAFEIRCEANEEQIDEGNPEMLQVNEDVEKEETDEIRVDEGSPEMSLVDKDVQREEIDEGSPEITQVDKDIEREKSDEIKVLGDVDDVRLNDEEMEKEKAIQKGDRAERFGTNQHYSIPVNFEDFGRRFVLTYPYVEKANTIDPAEVELDNAIQEFLEAKKEANKRLLPVKAPPEFVLSIATQSALLEAAKPKNPTDDVIRKDILRTGNFWDGVWKEDVGKEKLLRTSHKKTKDEFDPVTVTIAPGSKLHDLLSVLQERSPKLLYVIYKKD